jgi:hypothetical protein
VRFRPPTRLGVLVAVVGTDVGVGLGVLGIVLARSLVAVLAVALGTVLGVGLGVVRIKLRSSSPGVLLIHQRHQRRQQPGSACSTGGRPAPARRTRPSGSTPSSSSRTPGDTVSGLAPTNAATSFIPPGRSPAPRPPAATATAAHPDRA